MPEIIASTYEVVQKIGSGGGGNVYLAKHLRLNKMVVLKADKRKVTTKPELLRREVDVLKNLSHPYIPQVYDFFVEDDTVYTVMDYVKGESLDRPLKRGERFSQAQVITWGIQLLQALVYLHSPTHGDPPKGFIHSDIKPANLMLTPDGNICLIDFNISLALGEENIVGRSAGYASPEHYGVDFSGSGTASVVRPTEPVLQGTVYVPGGEVTEPAEWGGTAQQQSVSEGSSRSAQISDTSRLKKVVPDVRSDVYSTGATLYHLFCGNRPAVRANEVIPLAGPGINPQITAIISKAMAPNPDLRYQTAQEMLDALLKLHRNDPRAIRLRRVRGTLCAVCGTLLCVGVAVSFTGLKRMQTTESWLKTAEYSREALREGNVGLAVADAMKAFPQKSGIFTPQSPPQAQAALTDALGVYDLADSYKAHGAVELPSAPLYTTLSPDGKTAICVYSQAAAVVDTEACTVLATLPTDPSALSEAEYIDADTIVYAGADGLCAYGIAAAQPLWTGEPATGISVSADGTRIAAVYREEGSAIVYDAHSGTVLTKVDFGGKKQQVIANDLFANPNDNLLALNKDGTRLAVSFTDGSLQLFDLTAAGNDTTVLDPSSGYTHFEGGFSGKYFAFSASGEENPIFVVLDTATMEQTGGYQSQYPFGVRTDSDGIYVSTENICVCIDPVTGDQTPLVTTAQQIRTFATDGGHTVISTPDGFAFYDASAAELSANEAQPEAVFLGIAGETALVANRDEASIRLLRYESHPDTEIFRYDPGISHDEARVSADGNTVMLFNFREFSVYGMDGKLITKTEVPKPDQVYDQQFRRVDGQSYLEITYNDGTVLQYSAADGAQLSQQQGTPPDPTLYEELTTEHFRVESELHGAPVVYDSKTGRKIATLDGDDYLTYFTEAGPFVVAQFVTADGTNYGRLMDDKCNILATLPHLCDVMGEELIFDYPTGNMRKSRIYYINELIEKANTMEKG